MHWSILLNEVASVKFLLKNGADPTVRNKRGNNVLMIACINDKLDILRILVDHVLCDLSEKANMSRPDLLEQVTSIAMRKPPTGFWQSEHDNRKRESLKKMIN